MRNDGEAARYWLIEL